MIRRQRRAARHTVASIALATVVTVSLASTPVWSSNAPAPSSPAAGIAALLHRWSRASAPQVLREARAMIADPVALLRPDLARTMRTNSLVRGPARAALADFVENRSLRAGSLDPASVTRLGVSLSAMPEDLAVAVAILVKAETNAERIGATAFAGLSREETARLAHSIPDMLSRQRDWMRSVLAWVPQAAGDNRSDSKAPFATTATERLLARVDTGALAFAAEALAYGADLAVPYLRSYASERAGTYGSVNACDRPGPIFCDPGNLIEIWGTEDNSYSTDSPAIIRVDLGGNDTYHDRTATAFGGCSVNAPGPECVTGLALKMNLDVSGNDTYLADNVGGTTQDVRQGAGAFLGVGVLVDASGNDTYSAINGQGLGILAGAGLLVDDAGNDSYALGPIDSGVFGQGVGLSGVGALVDRAGRDRYDTVAGQGVAILGAGVLVDATGDDIYSCVVDCQGFGGALGAGILLDGKGNDLYGGSPISSSPGPLLAQGCAIAAGGAGLIDLAGNDHYMVADVGDGVAFAGGLLIDEVNFLFGTNIKSDSTDTFALFLDASGVDRYTSSGLQTYGYAEGLTWARFRDLGHSRDLYETSNPAPRNNAAWRQGDHGFVHFQRVRTGMPNGEGEDR